MDVSEIPYEAFAAGQIPRLKLVRAVPHWRAFSGGAQEYLIVIDDYPKRRAVVFKYATRTDRDADVELILRLPNDGEAAAGIPAWLNPHPPSRSAAEANPLPTESAA